MVPGRGEADSGLVKVELTDGCGGRGGLGRHKGMWEDRLPRRDGQVEEDRELAHLFVGDSCW